MAPPESILVIGDSNVSYSGTCQQPWRWAGRHSCGTLHFPSMVELLQRTAPCPVGYVPLPQLRGAHDSDLTIRMAAQTLPRPCAAVILVGQNDADEWSRYSTRGPEDLKQNFRLTMHRRVLRLQDLLLGLSLTPVWVLPFDDPKGEFTPLYQELVQQYSQLLHAVARHLMIAIPLQFETDQYHLLPASRVALATCLCQAVREECWTAPADLSDGRRALGLRLAGWIAERGCAWCSR